MTDIRTPGELSEDANLSFCVAAGNADGGTIEMRDGNANGEILGTCPVPATGGWDKYRTVSCSLKNRSGTDSLCLTFKGGPGVLMRLDWFSCGNNERPDLQGKDDRKGVDEK